MMIPYIPVYLFTGFLDSGKTTLVKLLLRLYDVDEGIIKINGYDYKTLNTKSKNKRTSRTYGIKNGNNARKLADKVSGLLSINDRKSYKYLYKTTEVNRTNNADVFLNIEIINEAISKNKKIGFQYLTYDKNGDPITRMNGFEYIVSPYYLINNYGRYYLLCNYRSKYQLLQNFRVDYMKNINILLMYLLIKLILI